MCGSRTLGEDTDLGSASNRDVTRAGRDQSEQCILDDWRRYIHEGIEPEISGRNNLGTMSMIAAAITSSDEARTAAIR